MDYKSYGMKEGDEKSFDCLNIIVDFMWYKFLLFVAVKWIFCNLMLKQQWLTKLCWRKSQVHYKIYACNI